MKAKALLFILLALAARAFCQWTEPDDESFDFDRDWRRKPLIPNDNLIFGQPEFLDFDLGGDFGYDDGLWGGINVRLDYTGGPFKVVGDLSFQNDQKYAPTRAMLPTGSIFGMYFFMNEGGITYDQGPLHLRAGRFKLYDEVDSPYSLYISSLHHAAINLNFRLESKHWIYQTQWIELNSRSSVSSPAWNEYARRLAAGDFKTASGFAENDTANLGGYGFPDRGIVYKIYALKVKDFRLGILDACVYTGRTFDWEYFFNPIPMFFINYAKDTAGRPWATDSNENALLGIFWDIKKPKWDAYVQLMMDDFGIGFLRPLFGNVSDNPWKAAWAVGGRWNSPVGRFGFHHGGALKFTFEPIGVDEKGRYAWDSAATAYGYTWYPETRYFDSESGGTEVKLEIEDNAVGYKHGENNIAFTVDYQNTFKRFVVNAELELVLAGANSPANPWHDYTSRSEMYDGEGEGSKLLNGAFEKRIEFRANVSRQIGPVRLWTAFAIGGKIDRLELQQINTGTGGVNISPITVDDTIHIWKPSNHNELIFRMSIGFRYTLSVL